MMESLEGTRVQEGLDGDPLVILKERALTGYLLISGTDESVDAALLSVDGGALGAEFINDEGRWLGTDALERIKHLKNRWIDIFQWTKSAIDSVLADIPEAKLVMSKDDMKALIEERRQRRLEALRNAPKDSDKGRGLTGLFAKVTEQVKGLESEKRSPAPATAEATVPEEARPVLAKVINASLVKPVGTPPMLTVNAPRARVVETDDDLSDAPDPEGKSFEQAITEGIDELKRLSQELDELIGE